MPDDENKKPAGDAQPAEPERGCPVVGIGASAGGLKALKELFEAMPADSGMGFVVVQHLDPKRESHMAELLGRITSMPVAEVRQGMRVEPDHVYVIRPNRELTFNRHVLHLADPSERRGARHPIDIFFRSLGEDLEERAIGVVLSGTGSNGSAGIRTIKELGGLTIAQNLETADHTGMPRSAIATGMIDDILAPAEIPDALLRHARQIEHLATQPEDLAEDGERAMNRLLAFLRARSGHEFRCYKKSTLTRRIHRRMSLCGHTQLPEYEQFLHRKPEEVDALVKDLMISVTGFFRDPGAWQALDQKVIARLVRERESGDSIRVWVPACATGEEAYTVAALLAARAEAAQKTFEVKIFATDTAEHHLESARRGVFPAAIENDVPPERLTRFFEEAEDSYRVKPELRDWVIFAPQDLLRDAPFFRLDLITCRNLLIYLEEEAQSRVLALFHFALNEGGHLFLGNAESVSHHASLFESVSKKWRIYRRLGPTRHDIIDFPIIHREGRARRATQAGPDHVPAVRPPAIAQRALAERYAPASVLIDRGNHILYFHGPTEKYLSQPAGEPTRDLLTMAREGVRRRLRGAVQEAIGRNGATSFEAWIRAGDAMTRCAVTVEPLRGPTADGLLLVSFEDAEESAAPAPTTPAPEADEQAREFEFETELQRVRDELSRTIEQLETSNEELKASNEEITSMNEELQSSNEELETSKEELQSLNEEVNTVNSQLQRKVEELEDTTNDLRNLLASTDIATIFLDRRLRIRWFTPAMTQLADLVGSDVGRPLAHFATRFADRHLLTAAQGVLEKLTPVEAEVEADDARWYLRRILPYRTQDDRIGGVVVTFTEVTAAKQSEQVLRAAHEHMQSIYDTMREPLLVLSPDLRVKSANSAFYSTFQVDPEDTEGRLVYELGDRQWDIPRLRELLGDILPANQAFDDFEVEHEFAGLGRRTMLLNARRLDDVQLILLAIEEVTARKQWEERQQMLLAELSHRVKNMLASVQSIASQTLRTSDTLESFEQRFYGRLQALSRTHELLTRGNWQSATLSDTLRAPLEAFESAENQIRLSGPELRVRPKSALTLGMVMNELATNAAKYGALSTPSGHVDLTWELNRSEPGPSVRLVWQEIGGRAVAPPDHRGFGLTLIERSVAHELDGEAKVEFLAQGIRCELLIPYNPENFRT